MTLTNRAYYSAVKANDRRFDGLFFTCVVSTGIYCRPICTAPTPKFEHCEFAHSAAEAERRGFRPCMRCRPERAPGTTPTDFSPAQRLALHIDRTLLFEQTLSNAASNLDISERHLRRQFVQLYGVEPKAYLTTRRLLFAKQLLQDTTMPITQIAYAAGFGSSDRLTINMKRAYGLTPHMLRKNKHSARGGVIVLKTDYRPPFDWSSLLQFLAGRATPNERVEQNAYYRTITNNLEIAVRHHAEKSQLSITIPLELSRNAYHYVQQVRRLFDLDANPAIISEVLSHHPVLKPLLLRYPGLRVPGCWDPFEMLLRVIIGQQISVAGATTIMRRLIERIGVTPEAIASSSPGDIAAIGMPRKRGETIWRLGVMVKNNQLDLEEMSPEIFYERLVAQPGIGPWTAQYLLMRVLHWPDALPAGDLGLQKAIDPPNRTSEKMLIQQLESVRPWRSYATILLWKSLENKGG